jgi:hypothetical protein
MLLGQRQSVLPEAFAQFADRGIFPPEGSGLGARYVAGALRLANGAADVAAIGGNTRLVGHGEDVGWRPGTDELRGRGSGQRAARLG